MTGGPLKRGAAAAGRAAAAFRRRFLETEPPLIAVEVRPLSLGVVRLVPDGERLAFGAGASVELPAGTLSLSMTKPNIVDPAAFGRTLRTALERVGALEGGGVALVLPDPVARVSLVPASDVAARGRTTRDEVLRFRLKKTVPFDVREARIATLAPRGGEGQLLVVAIHTPVLEGYERALVELGHEPGRVEMASLALADRAELTAGDAAFVNWDHGYASIAILREGWPILLRTLTGDFTASAEALVREAANTVLYYRERLGGIGLSAAVLRCAATPAEDAIALLREPLGVTPAVLDPWHGLAGADPGPAAQALAGAAAALRLGSAA